MNGLFGLCALGATILLPAMLWTFRYRPRKLSDPAISAGAALCLVTLTFAIDCLANAMVNPLYFVILGALSVPAKLKPLARPILTSNVQQHTPTRSPPRRGSLEPTMHKVVADPPPLHAG
jgi:hypothetical protein